MTQVQSTSSWDSLIPTSYKITAYIPSLKTSVTAGSFVRYNKGIEGEEDGGSHCRVGRILEVVALLDLVPIGLMPDGRGLFKLTYLSGYRHTLLKD